MEVFGWTIEQYEDAIIEAMHDDYEWYTIDMLRKIDKINIKKIDGLVKSRQNQNENTTWKREILKNAKQVVDAITYDIQQEIEWSPGQYLTKKDRYDVPFFPEELGGGWNLERYYFEKYEGDIFFSSVTAGDRNTGSSRNFYIPSRIIKGHTYEEFLDIYFSDIASAGAFGLGKEAVINDGQLKAFFGFTQKKDHPEVKEADLDDMTIFCMHNFIRGDETEHLKQNQISDNEDRIKEQWIKFRKKLPEAMEYAVKDNNNRIACYWGIMTEDNVYSENIDFSTSWGHYYRTGTYVAALQVEDDAPSLGYSSIWIRRELPARHYVVADVPNDNPDKYDEIFFEYINTVIPEMGYLLNGAILERIDPETEAIQLYFPVK